MLNFDPQIYATQPVSKVTIAGKNVESTKSRPKKKIEKRSIGDEPSGDEIQDISNILLIQEVEQLLDDNYSADQRKLQALSKRSFSALKALQINMLSGKEGKELVNALQEIVKEYECSLTNPELNYIYQQILVRMAVELAKAEKAKSAKLADNKN